MKKNIIFQKAKNLYDALLNTGLCEVVDEKNMWLQCEDSKEVLARLQDVCTKYVRDNEPKSYWNYKLVFMDLDYKDFVTV